MSGQASFHGTGTQQFENESVNSNHAVMRGVNRFSASQASAQRKPGDRGSSGSGNNNNGA